MICGIYSITNKKTGQMYIGQSVNIEKRFYMHKKGYNINKSYIDRAIMKYGIKNFDFQIIKQCKEKYLDRFEKLYIRVFNTYENNFHYNLTPGGDFCPSKIPEIGKKISKANSGKNHWNYKNPKNYHPSEKTKLKISQTMNTSGYFHVDKKKSKDCKQGYTWRYRYYKNNKRYAICNMDIKELEKKVKSKGLIWKEMR